MSCMWAGCRLSRAAQRQLHCGGSKGRWTMCGYGGRRAHRLATPPGGPAFIFNHSNLIASERSQVAYSRCVDIAGAEWVHFTRCDPWAFVFPTLQDGTAAPSAGLASAIKLEDIAAPLAAAMFQNTPNNSDGLLLSLTFDSGGAVSSAGAAPLELGSGSSWGGPPICAESGVYRDVCPGCNPLCAFGNCFAYNCSCLDRALSDTSTSSAARVLSVLANGVCACRDIAGCPSGLGTCSCPHGLARVCKSCGGRGVCGGGPVEGALCLFDSDCGAGGQCALLDPRFCPSTVCERWACECFPSAGGGNATGYLGMRASSDRSRGTGSCSCSGGLLLDMPLLPNSISGFDVNLPPYICCMTRFGGSASSVLSGVPCWEWNATERNIRCIAPPRAAFSTNGDRDCLLARCCSYPPSSGRRSGPGEKLARDLLYTSATNLNADSEIYGHESEHSSSTSNLLPHEHSQQHEVPQGKIGDSMDESAAQHNGQPNRRTLAVPCTGAAYVKAQLLVAGVSCLSTAALIQLQDQIVAAAARVNATVSRGSILVQPSVCTNSTPGSQSRETCRSFLYCITGVKYCITVLVALKVNHGAPKLYATSADGTSLTSRVLQEQALGFRALSQPIL
jgi:hypothetical protein